MPVVKLTKNNFDQTLENNDLVIIDFWAQWCSPCRPFSRVFEQVSNKYLDVLFGAINIEEEPDLAANFSIRSVPTTIILRQKIMILCESGALPAVALEDLIKQAKDLDMEQVLKQLGTVQ